MPTIRYVALATNPNAEIECSPALSKLARFRRKSVAIIFAGAFFVLAEGYVWHFTASPARLLFWPDAAAHPYNPA